MKTWLQMYDTDVIPESGPAQILKGPCAALIFFCQPLAIL